MPEDAVDPADLLTHELAQRRETGYDVSTIERRAAAGAGAFTLLGELESLPAPAGWAYDEPSTWAAIAAVLPAPVEVRAVDPAAYADRVHAAWLGRVTGNMLGKPVELGAGATPGRLRSYLERARAWPLTDYFPVIEPMPRDFAFTGCWPATTRGNVDGSSRDDDVDYTVLGLHLLEKFGAQLTAADVASEWLLLLPMHQTYTAERVAYRNLAAGLAPPETATTRNPYREWIGAQIRADAFGLVHPGNPYAAAQLAYVDASVSHVGNGVYGEMWAAALIAAAFTAESVRAAVQTSLSVVPPGSRLAAAVRDVLDMHASGLDWEHAVEAIWSRYGHYHWVHTINNAALLTAGILWGAGDFTTTIALTVLGGLDTDSTGATAGAVAGITVGTAGIPAHWTAPLHDTVHSALFGFDRSSIADLAARTIKVREALAAGS